MASGEPCFVQTRGRVGDSERLEGMRAAWHQSMEEVSAKGTAAGPFTLSQLKSRFGYGRYRPMGRFAVWQGQKWRPCDNARKSRTNRAYTSPEALTLTRPTYSAMVARAFCEEARRREEWFQASVNEGSPPQWTAGGSAKSLV